MTLRLACSAPVIRSLGNVRFRSIQKVYACRVSEGTADVLQMYFCIRSFSSFNCIFLSRALIILANETERIMEWEDRVRERALKKEGFAKLRAFVRSVVISADGRRIVKCSADKN